jgi:hypothetical protein
MEPSKWFSIRSLATMPTAWSVDIGASVFVDRKNEPLPASAQTQQHHLPKRFRQQTVSVDGNAQKGKWNCVGRGEERLRGVSRPGAGGGRLRHTANRSICRVQSGTEMGHAESQKRKPPECRLKHSGGF